jgi:hypothetical protein
MNSVLSLLVVVWLPLAAQTSTKTKPVCVAPLVLKDMGDGTYSCEHAGPHELGQHEDVHANL